MDSKSVTKRSVDALRCPPGVDRVFLWDDKLAGFGVVAYKSGRKVYVAQFRVNGRTRRMKIGKHSPLTPDTARKRAKIILGAVEDGKDPIEERRANRAVRIFRVVAEEFMQLHASAKRKPRTAVGYQDLLDLHLLPALGSRMMTEIRKVDVTALHTKLASRPGAANRAVALFSTIWNWAAKRDEPGVSTVANPARGVERYKENSKERYLSTAELARLGDALRLAETDGLPWEIDENKPTSKHVPKMKRATKLDLHAIAAIRLLILTGTRLREILHARWDFVDWERGLLFLPDSKTGKKTVYLSAPALAVLEGLPRLGKNPYIIPGNGQRHKAKEPKARKVEFAPRADLKRPWDAVARAADLEGVRLHDLRHSFAATGAGASLGLPMIGKLLGHSQPSTTARYAHLDTDPMHRAANLIGNQLAAALDNRSGKVVPMRSGNKR